MEHALEYKDANILTHKVSDGIYPQGMHVEILEGNTKRNMKEVSDKLLVAIPWLVCTNFPFSNVQVWQVAHQYLIGASALKFD